MTGPRGVRATLSFLGLFLSLIAPLAGQEGQDVPETPGVTLMPLAGVGFQGTRFSRNVRLASGEGFEETLGPTDGLVLGLGADFRIRPNAWLATGIGYSRLNYAFDQGEDDPGRRVVGGAQDFVRATGGVLYRVRPGASGFFSGGLVATYVRPDRPVYAPDESSRIELGGYAGLGADLGGGRHRLRIEARTYVVHPGADAVRRAGAEYVAKGVALDFAVLAGFLLPL